MRSFDGAHTTWDWWCYVFPDNSGHVEPFERLGPFKTEAEAHLKATEYAYPTRVFSWPASRWSKANLQN
jgi:hypothetical protein